MQYILVMFLPMYEKGAEGDDILAVTTDPHGQDGMLGRNEQRRGFQFPGQTLQLHVHDLHNPFITSPAQPEAYNSLGDLVT